VKKSTESALVRACLDFLALRGVFAFRVNTTGIFDPGRKVFRPFQGMRGVSDILGLLDGGRKRKLGWITVSRTTDTSDT